MSNPENNLVLEILKGIQKAQVDIRNDIRDFRTETRDRFARVELRLGVIEQRLSAMEVRLADIETEQNKRMERIECRLELTDA